MAICLAILAWLAVVVWGWSAIIQKPHRVPAASETTAPCRTRRDRFFRPAGEPADRSKHP
ncbi:hypothetical protein [Telmatospirillum siberiense]|uniref:hypothetical protein n=1 Tax=Telmatospirillum siberiense TaxID=382514 RepID=UPI0011AF652F|nr:hypothetical protein [Telmatospirillum siberiense]